MPKRRRRACALALTVFAVACSLPAGGLVDSGYDDPVSYYASALTASTDAAGEAAPATDTAGGMDDSSIPIVEFTPIGDRPSQPEADDDDTSRVTFYDWYGTEVSHVNVPVGDTIDAPAENPAVEGYAFEYWFDEVGELAPYAFDEPIEENLNLVPHYAILPPESSVRAITEDKVSSLILGILGEDGATGEADVSADVLAEFLPSAAPMAEIADSQTPLAAPVENGAMANADAGLLGLMGAQVKMTTVVTADGPVAEEAPTDARDDLAPSEAPVESGTLAQNPTNAPSTEPTQPPIEYNGVQVSTLITQILSTGSVHDVPLPEPQPSPPAAAATPVPEPSEAAPQRSNGISGSDVAPTTDPMEAAANIINPFQASPFFEVDELDEGQIHDMAVSILDTPSAPEPTATPEPEPATEAEPETEEPTEPEHEPETEPPAPEAQTDPYVEVRYDYKGELTVGSKVTLSAQVYNLPDGQKLAFQWQNNATGEFADVEGATGQTYTFIIESHKARGWNWRVNASFVDNE